MIGFDLQAAQSRSHGERGIARYVLALAAEIERIAPDRVGCYLVNPDRPLPESLLPFVRTGKVRRSDDLLDSPLSVLHMTSPMELDVPLGGLLVGNPRALVVNLYDLIPLVFPERYLTAPETSARYRSRVGVFQAADWILSDSQSAADDAARLLGVRVDRTTVIGAGTSELFRSNPEGPHAAYLMAKRALPQLRENFVMLPSGIDWRKNIEGAIEAYAGLSRDLRLQHQLVLVCRVNESERAALTALTTSLKCADSVFVTGFVSDETLIALNQAAKLVMFPSRYEGFGLPVLEAMRCGAPVICGDNSSLREVQPNPRARFNSEDVAALRQLLERLLSDPSELDAIRQAPPEGLTWERAARSTLDVYDRFQAEAEWIHVTPPQPRIALVSPLPPLPSGIADYSYRLVEGLLAHASVRCFSDQPLGTCRVPPGATLGPIRDLPTLAALGEFDHVVYVLGNNEIHRSALEMMRVVPGVAHLHDVRLTNCYVNALWPDIVDQHYPGRFSDAQLQGFAAPWAPAVVSNNLFLLGDVRDRATFILTNSAHAADLVRLDSGRRDVVSVGPLATRGGSASGPGHREDLVVSIGHVSEAKQSSKVAAAFQLLSARRPELRCVIAGPCPDDYEVPGAEVLGYVDDTVLDSLLAAAKVAVQLRGLTNGESSAAVADCLAAGVAAVVTDIGAQAELPDATVLKVPKEITASDLADRVERVLDDEAARSRLAEAGLAYARMNTFEIAGQRLLAALAEAQSIRRSSNRVGG
jgi:glycosyltransferase involved in cell wall biosynthesis